MYANPWFGLIILQYEEVFCLSEHSLIATKEQVAGISCYLFAFYNEKTTHLLYLQKLVLLEKNKIHREYRKEKILFLFLEISQIKLLKKVVTISHTNEKCEMWESRLALRDSSYYLRAGSEIQTGFYSLWSHFEKRPEGQIISCSHLKV